MTEKPSWGEPGNDLPDELARALRGAPSEPSDAALQLLASRLSHALEVTVVAPHAGVATKAALSAKPAVGLLGSTLLGVAMGVGLSAVVAVSFSTDQQPEAGRGSGSVSTRTPPLPPTVVVAPPPGPPAAEPSVAPLPTSQASRVPSPSTRASTDSSPLEVMEAELGLLRQARAALDSDPGRALSLCADHARMFARGALGQEREVIAIDALLRAGRLAEARERARLFNERFPASAHARRVAALLERSSPH